MTKYQKEFKQCIRGYISRMHSKRQDFMTFQVAKDSQFQKQVTKIQSYLDSNKSESQEIIHKMNNLLPLLAYQIATKEYHYYPVKIFIGDKTYCLYKYKWQKI